MLLNGQLLLASARTWDPVGYSYAWIGCPLRELLPQPGHNTIEVAVRARPAQPGKRAFTIVPAGWKTLDIVGKDGIEYH